jgi:hypothetical protein
MRVAGKGALALCALLLVFVVLGAGVVSAHPGDHCIDNIGLYTQDPGTRYTDESNRVWECDPQSPRAAQPGGWVLLGTATPAATATRSPTATPTPLITATPFVPAAGALTDTTEPDSSGFPWPLVLLLLVVAGLVAVGGLYLWLLSGIGGMIALRDGSRRCNLAEMLGARRYLLQRRVPFSHVIKELLRTEQPVDASIIARRKLPVRLQTGATFQGRAGFTARGRNLTAGEEIDLFEGDEIRFDGRQLVVLRD